jgi:hypothetical protein
MKEEAEIAQSRRPHAETTDSYLQILVKMVNDVEERISLPITLLVGGTLVSGLLIGIREYFESFAEEFTKTFADREAAASVRESIVPDLSAPSEGDPLPQYIHLKDARYYGAPGGPIVAGPGVLWRGRISEVGGFHYGRLTPLPEQ